MVKKVAALEERAFELNADLCSLRPWQYKEQEGNEKTELAKWWNVATWQVGMASIALSILLNQLEERAGLDHEMLELQRERERGLMPREEAADEATENAGGATT